MAVMKGLVSVWIRFPLLGQKISTPLFILPHITMSHLGDHMDLNGVTYLWQGKEMWSVAKSGMYYLRDWEWNKDICFNSHHTCQFDYHALWWLLHLSRQPSANPCSICAMYHQMLLTESSTADEKSIKETPLNDCPTLTPNLMMISPQDSRESYLGQRRLHGMKIGGIKCWQALWVSWHPTPWSLYRCRLWLSSVLQRDQAEENWSVSCAPEKPQLVESLRLACPLLDLGRTSLPHCCQQRNACHPLTHPWHWCQILRAIPEPVKRGWMDGWRFGIDLKTHTVQANWQT